MIKEYARVPDARSLAVSPSDIVYVGNKFLGEVYAVMDKDNDKKGETVALLLSGLTSPNGIAFHLPTGNLVVAERSHIWTINNIEELLASFDDFYVFLDLSTSRKLTARRTVVRDALPPEVMPSDRRSTTAGATYSTDQTAPSICHSGPRAMFVSERKSMRRSSAIPRLAITPITRSSPTESETALALTGTRQPRSCGSLTTVHPFNLQGATSWGTGLRTNSTTPRLLASTSAFLTALARISLTRR